MPKIHVPWLRVGKWGIVIGVVVLIIVATPQFLKYRADEVKDMASSSKTIAPAYAPLKPDSDKSTVAGASFDSKRQLYKYDDQYNDVKMTISQQPLPDNLRSNPDAVAGLAKSIGANEKVATTNGDAFISTDDKTATQRVVVVHRQLLVFIQSSRSMSNSDWVAYIQKLQ